MKLLLDTHTFIWYVNGDVSISENARELIENPSNEKHISIASLWEMAIKISVGKLTIKGGIRKSLDDISLNNFLLLPILPDHLTIIESLLFHHRDPFDRLIVAQAICENISILSKDPNFKKYKVNVLW
ncbi:MAG: type II toxin-antitoxin system VapC family toxin [Bacteroidetes bacterium]|nr:type II toxin-antitoxin system VapC family toxin [Bacteroidota bacterium]